MSEAVNKGLVLVMDDEELILNVADKMLEKLGYKAGFARNGDEAIELYQNGISTGNKFDVVILDLTISNGMGADVAVKRLLEIDPDVCALISTGFSTDPVAKNYQEYGFKGCISKPYGLTELKETLEEFIQ